MPGVKTATRFQPPNGAGDVGDVDDGTDPGIIVIEEAVVDELTTVRAEVPGAAGVPLLPWFPGEGVNMR